jgi:hypothetical protein
MKSIFFGALIGALATGATAGAQTKDHAAPPAATQGSGPTGNSARNVAPPDSSRRYDAQALRFESHWGSADIRRGISESVVATVGWFRDYDVEKLVASSPHAVAEARAFKTENFRGSLVGGFGAVAFITGVVVTSNSSNNAASPILIIAGAGAMVWGAQHLSIGYAALSRAFWWYNRDLPR